MSAHNKFLSFLQNTNTESSSNSTFIVEAESKILSIDVKETDEILYLPDAETSKYDFVQYRKDFVNGSRDVIIDYKGFQKGKLYSHRKQHITFSKFKNEETGTVTWIS